MGGGWLKLANLFTLYVHVRVLSKFILLLLNNVILIESIRLLDYEFKNSTPLCCKIFFKSCRVIILPSILGSFILQTFFTLYVHVKVLSKFILLLSIKQGNLGKRHRTACLQVPQIAHLKKLSRTLNSLSERLYEPSLSK